VPRRISDDELARRVGEEIAVSDWLEITQERIDRFAAATDDLQWIHTDPERAAAESPYGRTIAHGFLTLALTTCLSRNAFELSGDFKMGVNYGLNRVRFPAPVPAGARIRARFTLNRLTQFDGGVELCWGVIVDSDQDSAKPCMAAEWITRRYR